MPYVYEMSAGDGGDTAPHSTPVHPDYMRQFREDSGAPKEVSYAYGDSDGVSKEFMYPYEDEFGVVHAAHRLDLDPEDDDYLPSEEQATMAFKNLNYHLTVGKRKKKQRRHILKNVTGIAEPGHLLAIMGPSGAGKTCLLNALAGRLPSEGKGELSGLITVNGQARKKSFRQQVGYVMQDDVFFSNLTVAETLTLAAKLKLPKGTTEEQIKHVVDTIIAELSLTQARNSKIGGPAQPGISGGERKRVNVGTELINKAPFIFLDEPTSNLDAFQALNVMSSLREIASRGRAIVSTIHQPRSSIYQLFDQLLLLSEGEVIYNGPAADAVGYFANIRYKCPELFNPADYFLDIIAVDRRTEKIEQECEARVRELVAQWQNSQVRMVTEQKVERSLSTPVVIPEGTATKRKYPSSYVTQIRLLAFRSVKQIVRDKFSFVLGGVILIFFAIILGLFYFDLGREYDQKSIQGRQGLLFFILLQSSFVQFGAVQNTFPSEKRVVNRERQAKMYHVGAYYLAKSTTEMCARWILPIVYCAIVYWMVGLKPTVGAFFFFVLLVEMVTFVALALGLFVSSLVPTPEAAAALGPLVIIIFLLPAGFYQNVDKLPVWIEWFQWCSYLRYAFEAGMINEFTGLVFTCTPTDPVCIPNGETVLERASLSTSFSTAWRNIGILAAMVFIFHGLAYLSLRFKNKGKFIRLSATNPQGEHSGATKKHPF